jgi:hypothetical protein
MPHSHAVTVISPLQVWGTGEIGPYPFEQYAGKCLAQGDSWFSIGSLPPGLTTNVLAQLELGKSVVAVNCARPGAVLHHMADTCRDPQFVRLLAGPLALKWNAILLSGGGNDLIDAASVSPTAAAHLRLLARPEERGAGPLLGDDYISKPGWKTFSDHLEIVFNDLVDLRDSGINKGTPLLLHTYAPVMPRPAGAGLGFGPWLQPSLTAFGVPASDWLMVSNALNDRLVQLLQTLIAARLLADPTAALHLVDTRSAQLQLADQTSAVSSGDFLNEIHPTRGGYTKVAAVWRQSLDPLVV